MWYVWFGKKILPFLKYGGVILLGLIVVLSFAQNLPIPGNFKSLVVMSGSMEPKIHVGAVAIVKPSEEVKVGEIITFKDPRDPKNLITHRVVEIGENEVIKTKGDANNTADNWEVKRGDIVGKFLFSLPLLGYAVDFAKRPQGFLLLILFPAILIVANEVASIKKELNAKKVNAKNAKENKGALAATVVSAILFTFAFSSGRTLALLSDTETSSGNTITVGVWDVAEYSVVLNEFVPNPAGNDDALRPGGEWVELYNNGSVDFDLAGWYLYDDLDSHELPITSVNSASSDSGGNPINSNTTVIPAHGFLLVYRNGDGDFSLDNTGGDTVRLYNGTIGSTGVILIDSHTYTINANEDKSFARIPDGSDNWVDPVPTPGGPNKEDIVQQYILLNYSEEVTEPEVEQNQTAETEPEPETEDVAAAVSAAPEDPPESTESAQPVAEPQVPESTESAQPVAEPQVPESTESAQPQESDE